MKWGHHRILMHSKNVIPAVILSGVLLLTGGMLALVGVFKL